MKGSFKPQLEKGRLFTTITALDHIFPPRGLSVTGGEITNMSAALIHMSRVSFVPPAQFSPLAE